ncbi:MAG TPA: hypothetical protein VNO26_04220 [Candidatus Limnocylindria bacterium]|nr:hypothetical protein [Candidatus Limnocylindria bacterium]
MSLRSLSAAILLAVVLAEPAAAGRVLGFRRTVTVIAPAYSAPLWYPPYAALPYGGAYLQPAPFAYGWGPAYVPGANWRDSWYDATRTKVHGYTLR